MIDERDPSVSVILPARNEARYIAGCLRSLQDQEYPPELIEIIVVDNGSTDGTSELAKSYGVTVAFHSNGTVGKLRNVGSGLAQGEVLAFLDADCIAPPGWLRNAVNVLQSQDVGAVGGGCTAPDQGSWTERAWPIPLPDAPQEVEALASSSFIIRKAVFDQVGGFNSRLSAGEDDDLSSRLRRRGYRLISVPECGVVHLGYPSTLPGVLRRQVWHGKSQLKVAASRKDRLLWLTHAFAIAVVSVLTGGLAMLLGQPWGVLLTGMAAGASAGMAGLAALHRKPRGLLHFAQLAVIMFFFLLGRAFGLAMGYYESIVGPKVGRGEASQ